MRPEVIDGLTLRESVECAGSCESHGNASAFVVNAHASPQLEAVAWFASAQVLALLVQFAADPRAQTILMRD